MLYSLCRYKNLPTYVTENGLAWQEDTVEQAVNDTMRQQYLHDHIDAVGQALQAGCDVRGYFVWSFQVGNRSFSLLGNWTVSSGPSFRCCERGCFHAVEETCS